MNMTKFTSYGAGFVYKGDPEVLRLFLIDVENQCNEKGIKVKFEKGITVEL
jgi:hypothetical protein